MCTITESGKVVLSLLQMPGIGRKTVIQHCCIEPETKCDLTSLRRIIEYARKNNSRIKQSDTETINSAVSKATQIIETCEKYNIKIISYVDTNYPERLFSSDDPPAILYYIGSIDFLNQGKKAVAIIGTLTPTDLGSRIAIRIGERIAEAGFISVSGLALGCDTGGHTGSINKSGLSVAILANGLEKVYPEENTDLAKKITEHGGCIISEYPPETIMQRGYFVDRDRLQAALSDAIFVVETDIQDGTMHTVSFGRKYGKPIYCFKHPENYLSIPVTQGNQKLIIDGTAIPIGDKDDIANFISDINHTLVSPIRRPKAFEQLSLL